MKAITTLALSLLITVALQLGSARANFFQDVWGVVTDPLGLRRSSATLSDAVERALIQLRELERDANSDVRERLEQIRSIVREALSGADGAIAKALAAMLELEARTNQDALRLIYRAQCSVSDLQTQFRETLARMIVDLKNANPGVDIFGYRAISTGINGIVIENPDQAYRSTRDATLAALNKKLTDKSDAYEILSTYQNLIRAAQFARCHYIGEGLEARLFEQINEWRRLSEPWVSTVKPKM